MILRASTINAIFKNDLKRFWVVGLLYLFLIFLFIPFDMLILLSKGGEREELTFFINQIFSHPNQNFIIGMFIITLLVGLIIVREIQAYRSNIHIFSLPLTKKDILLNKIFVGIVLIIMPILINFVITEVVYIVFNAKGLIQQNLIISFYFMLFIVCLIFLLQSFLIGIITSNSLFQLSGSLVFNFIPIIFFIILHNFLSVIFYGIYLDRSFDTLLSNRSFMFYLFPFASWLTSEIAFNKIVFADLAYSILAILIYLTLLYILFTKRKNEKATKLIVFDKIADGIKYFNTFLIMLAISSFTTVIVKGTIKTVFIFTIIGAF
ncbi:hypothetical protein PL321_04205 [Caloramator sp. mosi_1]|uniref:hypothetical protein n=1 Tax=Caloramator sp. mosi_1 TaxID=3023090 RepID=UPI00235FAA14|nr:hypothetical protein [Caloramator sp. mosi_1]WDC84828.1 hypothetical protein PL321_04205 [Caloramator sp. mosi_1]